ncbi:hypothetical protein LC613_07475 [Nostoc sphaeroides CHAB 2801]|uniref:hypothetical protein n=1 Tax=Nostoc sphaeroides TaxID=446679 RepID=UPI001E58A833|nr:hypothetical protein [Nostoc sphaeroides]MCC5627981.1 hypothetical protein [Nostoc sphaeroides CHAB 2801]
MLALASELERVARKLGFEKVRQERLSCSLATSRWTSNHNSYTFYEILKQLDITEENFNQL